MASMVTLKKEVQKVIDQITTNVQKLEKSDYDIKYPPIVLHINSPGGSIFAAFMFIDFMTQTKVKNPKIIYHSIVEGVAASAATLISVTPIKDL